MQAVAAHPYSIRFEVLFAADANISLLDVAGHDPLSSIQPVALSLRDNIPRCFHTVKRLLTHLASIPPRSRWIWVGLSRGSS